MNRLAGKLVLLLAVTLAASAQESGVPAEDAGPGQPRFEPGSNEQVVHEIVVTGQTWRTPDMGSGRLREREEDTQPGRISWGYDPGQEAEFLQRENPLYNQARLGIKPAKVLEIRF